MPSAQATRKQSRETFAGKHMRAIRGVPARFMAPRLIVIACSVFLALFGLLMIYSSSSITALNSASFGNDPTYFLTHQAINLAIGTAMAVVIATRDYHFWARGPVFLALVMLVVLLLLLVETPFAGQDAYGATRWIAVPGFGTLQPSEFAKPVVILAGAGALARYYEEHSIDRQELVLQIGAGIIVPLLLILLQPDKGTTIIIGATLIVMALIAGFSWKVVAGAFVAGAIIFGVYSYLDGYSRQRIITMMNPWEDPYGSGYQLIQGWYAFGSGGLFGVGIGFSHQKYAYLPMAYNDFIFAIVGEECGLVGTIGIVCIFLLLLFASYKIANYAPDLLGRLIACGCSTILVVQLFVNIGGVLGLMPLSGKPVPFLSYGGSSIMSCCILVGLILSVSRSSILPETEHDRARSQLRVADGTAARGGTGVGEVMTRSESRAQASAPTFRVVEGGASVHAEVRAHAEARAARRASESRSSRDLMDPASRLRRPDTGPQVRTRTQSPHLNHESTGRRRPRRGR